MQVSIESSEGLERKMTVELPAEKVTEAVEQRLKEIARTARLDGFRPGKVPMSVVRKRFSGEVRAEIFGNLVQSSYFEALTQEKLNPAGEPKIEPVEKDPEEGMAYTAVFEVMPEIALNPLDEITIKQSVAEVTDADLAAMIEKLRKQRVTWTDADKEAASGDQITINFKGFMDGEAFEGGSADDVPLELGSQGMIPGFEEGLTGVKAGDTRTLELSFPENYHAKELAGKPATFEVEVTKVSEATLPEIDEEFAQAFGVTEGGVEGFQKEIRNNMGRELDEKIRNMLKEQAMDALLEVNPIDVPQAMIVRESQALLEQTKQNLAQGQGGQASDLNLPLEIFADQAKKRVSLGLIMAEVLRANDIQIDEAQVRSKIEQVAQPYENPQEVVDYYYSNQEQLAGVQNVVLEDQVVSWVLEQAKTEEINTDFETVMNPPAPEVEAEGE